MSDGLIKIEITEPADQRAFARASGVADVLVQLETTEQKYGKMPVGFGMALEIARRELADQRVQLSRQCYVIAIKAGHDISNMHVSAGVEHGRIFVELRPFDLVDAASA